MTDVFAQDNAHIELKGGTFTSTANSNLDAAIDARIDVFGANFAINGIPVGFGPIQAHSNSFGRLTGTLAMGQDLNVLYNVDPPLRGHTASINLVFEPIPEPSTVLLLASGLAALAVRRRRSLTR